MDPVTTALLSAAAVGATAGTTETVKEAVCDAYDGLKGLLQRKFGLGSDVVEAVAKLEAKPDSKARRDAVAEEVASAKVDSDAEIVAAAEAVLKTLEEVKIPTASTTTITQKVGKVDNSQILQIGSMTGNVTPRR